MSNVSQHMLLHRLLVARLAAIAFGALASIASYGQTTLTFGEGAGEVTIPAHYSPVEDKDASLVVLSKPEGNVRLYFDLHKLDAAVRVARPGEALVREQAKKKGKQVKQHAGKVLFFDPSAPAKMGEETVLNLHWQIGFDKTLVVMSARVPQAAREAPDVKRFLSGDIEAIIASLRRVGG
jgi:hypothetical protein